MLRNRCFNCIRASFSKWHKPLPLSKHEEKVLLEDLRRSFQSFMDVKHPEPALWSNHYTDSTSHIQDHIFDRRKLEDLEALRSSSDPVGTLNHLIDEERFQRAYLDQITSKTENRSNQDLGRLLEIAESQLGLSPALVSGRQLSSGLQTTALYIIRMLSKYPEKRLTLRSWIEAFDPIWIQRVQSTPSMRLNEAGILELLDYYIDSSQYETAIRAINDVFVLHAKCLNYSEIFPKAARRLLRHAAKSRNKELVLRTMKFPWFSKGIHGQEIGLCRWLIEQHEYDAAWKALACLSHHRQLKQIKEVQGLCTTLAQEFAYSGEIHSVQSIISWAPGDHFQENLRRKLVSSPDSARSASVSSQEEAGKIVQLLFT